MFGRHLLQGPLLDEATGDPTGGAPPPAPAPQPPAPVDAAKLEAEAHAKALKTLGFDSQEAFDADKKARKKAADEKLSESERQAAALKDALDARGASETAAEKHKAEVKALKEQLELRDIFDEHAVSPKERRIVEVLRADAVAAEKKAGKAWDEAAFFTKLRAERPYLFGAAAGAERANTAPGAPPPPSPFGSGPPVGGGQVDALTMSDAEYLQYRNTGRAPARALAPRGIDHHGPCPDPRRHPRWCRQAHRDQPPLAGSEGRAAARLDVPQELHPRAASSAHRRDAHQVETVDVRRRSQARFGAGRDRLRELQRRAVLCAPAALRARLQDRRTDRLRAGRKLDAAADVAPGRVGGRTSSRLARGRLFAYAGRHVDRARGGHQRRLDLALRVEPHGLPLGARERHTAACLGQQRARHHHRRRHHVHRERHRHHARRRELPRRPRAAPAERRCLGQRRRQVVCLRDRDEALPALRRHRREHRGARLDRQADRSRTSSRCARGSWTRASPRTDRATPITSTWTARSSRRSRRIRHGAQAFQGAGISPIFGAGATFLPNIGITLLENNDSPASGKGQEVHVGALASDDSLTMKDIGLDVVNSAGVFLRRAIMSGDEVGYETYIDESLYFLELGIKPVGMVTSNLGLYASRAAPG